MYYGLGAMIANPVPITKIVLTIVQPRCFHPDGNIRSWETTGMELLDFAAQLVSDAKNTEDPDATLKTGDHCRWCKAQGICPAIQDKALSTAQMVFAPAVSYDPAKLADTLEKLDQIEAWAKSVRSFAYSEAEAGRIPPGYKLVDKRATRKWKEGLQAANVAMVFGVELDQVLETKMKSPAQVEKLVGKSAAKDLEELTVKESSGRNLVKESDARRPSLGNQASDVFETIETL
jgi:hypothetical protein